MTMKKIAKNIKFEEALAELEQQVQSCWKVENCRWKKRWQRFSRALL